MIELHNPHDPLCKCERCRKVRAEQIAIIDANRKRSQEVMIESGLKASRRKK
jgi:hypothetical protein